MRSFINFRSLLLVITLVTLGGCGGGGGGDNTPVSTTCVLDNAATVLDTCTLG
jgi:hypothetical protein